MIHRIPPLGLWPESKKRSIVRLALTPKPGTPVLSGVLRVKVVRLDRQTLAPPHLADALRPYLAALADLYPGAAVSTDQKVGRSCVTIEILEEPTP